MALRECVTSSKLNFIFFKNFIFLLLLYIAIVIFKRALGYNIYVPYSCNMNTGNNSVVRDSLPNPGFRVFDSRHSGFFPFISTGIIGTPSV